MKQEVWKNVPNYEGLYQVSSLGRVKSLEKTLIRSNGRPNYYPEKILKAGKDHRGYLMVVLTKNKKPKTIRVHKLVAICFLNHIPNGYKITVDHINEVKTDNRVENLQLVSNRENCSRSKKNKSSKYTGVCYVKNKNKWMSRIRIKDKSVFLGYFTKEEDAAKAYQDKLKEIKDGQQ